MVRIPLFPLQVILFPHMPLGLHIFEPRYKAMLRDCRESGTSFGVVAIRSGCEVGAAADPHGVGTLASIERVERLEDGGYQLLVVGTSRFRIRHTHTHRPYLMGEIEYLAEAPAGDPALDRLCADVAGSFRRYTRALRGLVERPEPALDLPRDPEVLSYLVAATLAVDLGRKQELLETEAVSDRLRRELQLMRREQSFLDQQLAHRTARVAVQSLN